jgi:cell division septation protein DedD
MLEERRQFPRLVPSTPLFVSMDEAKGGLLLDLCEGGLAVASLVPRNLDDVVSVTFDLPEGVGHIEAKARVAWTRDSGHLTGVRFMDLDEVSHQQLSEWIAAGTNLRPAGSEDLDEPVIVTRSTYAQVDAIRREVRPETRTAIWPEMQVAEPKVEVRPVAAAAAGAAAGAKGGQEMVAPELSMETIAELERIETAEKVAAALEMTGTLFPEPTVYEDEAAHVERSGAAEVEEIEAGEVEELEVGLPAEIGLAGPVEEAEEELKIPEMGIAEIETAERAAMAWEPAVTMPQAAATAESVEPEEFVATREHADRMEPEAAIEAAEGESATAGSTNRAEWVEHVAQMEDVAPVEVRLEGERQTLPPDAETVGWASDAVGWVQEIAEKRVTAPEEAEFDGVFVPEEAMAVRSSRSGKSRHTIELVLAVVLLTWALVFLGYQMGSTGANQATRDLSVAKVAGGAGAAAGGGRVEAGGKAGASAAATTTSAEAFPEMSPVPPITRTGKVSIPDLKTNAAALEAPGVAPGRSSTAVATVKTPAPVVASTSAPRAAANANTTSGSGGETQVLAGAAPAMNSGVVLQVGAMKMEGNATALMQDLKKKKFSAFVYRHGNDNLYRVGVGPFGDKDASARVKAELQKNGYSAITAKWAKDKG